MDYKYIDQLIDRYFRAETTLDEERILRAFFRQSDLPEKLERVAPLFRFADEAELRETLGPDFDEQARAAAGEPAAKVRRPRLAIFTPLLRAAAVVALVVLAADFAQRDSRPAAIAPASAAADTYSDPQEAYSQVEDALNLISDGLDRTQRADSAARAAADTTAYGRIQD